MKKRGLQTTALVLTLMFMFIFPLITYAQELNPIQLLKPQTEGGRPLMQALKDRKTDRAFSPEKLPLQTLSNLLWAAFGINRPDLGKRTAPSAMNWQEIDLYVVLPEGAYLYDAKNHLLQPVNKGDFRGLTGIQPFVKEAPVNLIYVADFSKMTRATNENKEIFSTADTGAIFQNVYLFCASEGLATGVRAGIDKTSLAKALQLRPDQKIVLAQSVGYPKK
ncbi:MAG: SagB/ThcOx family dehydrogenase [Thermodesulfobacteriota bacterium]